MKEAYTIYMSVKKLSFYIDTAKITVKSDHLPLKKFLEKNTLLQLEEAGKEFGYFPFEELPLVTTQVIEEVIECEIGNLNIQHTDPVEVNVGKTIQARENSMMSTVIHTSRTHPGPIITAATSTTSCSTVSI